MCVGSHWIGRRPPRISPEWLCIGAFGQHLDLAHRDVHNTYIWFITLLMLYLLVDADYCIEGTLLGLGCCVHSASYVLVILYSLDRSLLWVGILTGRCSRYVRVWRELLNGPSYSLGPSILCFSFNCSLVWTMFLCWLPPRDLLLGSDTRLLWAGGRNVALVTTVRPPFRCPPPVFLGWSSLLHLNLLAV